MRVEILRHGKAAAQIRAQLSSLTTPGPGLEVSATFARRREGVDFTDTEPPPVARPESLAPVEEMPGLDLGERPRFFSNFDTRIALGSPWWTDDWEPGAAKIGRWFRYRVPQPLADGRFDPLAIPPIADTMPPALIQKLGPRRLPFVAPSLDLTVHFLADTTAEWFFALVHARWAQAGYATASSEIWDDRGTLVALATQMMFLRRAPKPPA